MVVPDRHVDVRPFPRIKVNQLDAALVELSQALSLEYHMLDSRHQ